MFNYMIEYTDIILKNLREYMCFKKEPIDKQVYIITFITKIYSSKSNTDSIIQCINNILDDGKITFSDMPELINLCCKSIDIILMCDNVKYPTIDILRYFIFYTINMYANNEIKYMTNDDLIKFYDSLFELSLMKIAKVNCCYCCKK